MRIPRGNLAFAAAFMAGVPALCGLYLLAESRQSLPCPVFVTSEPENHGSGWVTLKFYGDYMTTSEGAVISSEIRAGEGPKALWMNVVHNHDHGRMEAEVNGAVFDVSGFDPSLRTPKERWIRLCEFDSPDGKASIRLTSRTCGESRKFNQFRMALIAPADWSRTRVERAKAFVPYHREMRIIIGSILIAAWVGACVLLWRRWRMSMEPVIVIGSEKDRRESLSRIAVMLSASLTLVALFYSLCNSYNIPFWDEWAICKPFTLEEPVSARWLWESQNEHRMPLPKMLNLCLAALTRWNICMEALIATALFCASILFHAKTLSKLGGGRLGMGLLAVPLLVATLGQAENLVWGIQTSWAAVAFFTSIVVYNFDAENFSFRTSLKVLAPLAVVCLSSAHGLMLAMTVSAASLAAALIKRPRAPAFFTFAAAAAMIPLYFMDYRAPGGGGSDIVFCLGNVDECAIYMMAFIGSPFSGGDPGLASVFGAVFAVLLGVLPAGYVLLPRKPGAATLLSRTILLPYSLILAAAVTFGRIHLGIEGATSSRYLTIAVLPWIGWLHAAYLLFGGMENSQARGAFRFWNAVALSLALFAYVMGVKHSEDYARNFNSMSGVGLLRILAGERFATTLYPDWRYLMQETAALRKARRAVFAFPDAARTHARGKGTCDPDAWSVLSGARETVAHEGGRRFVSLDNDPMLELCGSLDPGEGARLVVTATVSAGSAMQLFWNKGRGYSETDSTRVEIFPGERREYSLPLPGSGILALRLDPTEAAGADIIIEDIRLEKGG